MNAPSLLESGILGCSVAVHLVDRGLRPVIIDPQRPGLGLAAVRRRRRRRVGLRRAGEVR
jgi:hypothetical protein